MTRCPLSQEREKVNLTLDQAQLRQVIDATRIAENRKIDGIFLLYGKGNIKPLISYLRNLGIEVYAGVITPDENSAKCNQTIILEEGLLYTQVSHAAPKKAAPAPKRVKKAKKK